MHIHVHIHTDKDKNQIFETTDNEILKQETHNNKQQKDRFNPNDTDN